MPLEGTKEIATMNRRETLKMMAAAPVAAGFSWTQHELEVARENMQKAGVDKNAKDFEPEFFTAHELDTVNVLVDLIIPADDRSGSATDAGVPAFMDFMMMDRPTMQLPMRGGLAWVDAHDHELLVVGSGVDLEDVGIGGVELELTASGIVLVGAAHQLGFDDDGDARRQFYAVASDVDRGGRVALCGEANRLVVRVAGDGAQAEGCEGDRAQ